MYVIRERNPVVLENKTDINSIRILSNYYEIQYSEWIKCTVCHII